MLIPTLVIVMLYVPVPATLVSFIGLSPTTWYFIPHIPDVSLFPSASLSVGFIDTIILPT